MNYTKLTQAINEIERESNERQAIEQQELIFQELNIEVLIWIAQNVIKEF